MWYFIPTILTSSVLPAIANARKISRKLYPERLRQLSTLMVWLAIAIAILVTFFSELIIQTLYGSAFQGASQVLTIHIWGAIFVFMGISSGVFFTLENYRYKSLYRALLGIISNALLNLILIPMYGIIGAAIAAVVSQFFANFLLDFFDDSLRELLKIKIESFFPLRYFILLRGY
jgi:O-antigen/teichoic acid export membrane protein